MSFIAPILEKTRDKIRFCVDEVDPIQKRLPLQAAKFQLEKSLEAPVLAFSHNDGFQVIQGNPIHPLALAVHVAFSEHYSLLLTPDIIWMTIAQGFAQHVKNHAEELRSRFVRHLGKVELVVARNSIPTLSQHWAETIQEWVLHIRDHVGPDVYKLLECNFSTTTPITHTASHVVMMDAFQQYFDYVMLCGCGIPDITLLGTLEDWQSIYERVQNMSQYNLNWWTDRLLPICKEFINAASGKPSLEFWRCIYKPETVYDVEYITGWLADLFPYVQHPVSKAPTVRNQLLLLDRCELPIKEDAEDETPIFLFKPVHNGISLDSLPLGLSQVAFKLAAEDANRMEEYELNLVAGFIGVSQDSDQGVLQPEIGWATQVQGNCFEKLLDRIQREHITQPPIDWSKARLHAIPKEFVQMLGRFDGATLYADSCHSWEITKCHFWSNGYEVSDDFCYFLAYPFIDLKDGRCIAFNFNFRSRKCWFLLGKREDEFANPVVIAKSISQLFELILGTEGSYYFDDWN